MRPCSIYFTSESHIHSLMNVLRYCHTFSGSSAALSALKDTG